MSPVLFSSAPSFVRPSSLGGAAPPSGDMAAYFNALSALPECFLSNSLRTEPLISAAGASPVGAGLTYSYDAAQDAMRLTWDYHLASGINSKLGGGSSGISRPKFEINKLTGSVTTIWHWR